MSGGEWAVTEPTLPEPAWRRGRGGRPAQHCRRDIVDAIRYLVKEGIQWRAMPADFLSVTWNQTFRAILSGTVSPVAEERR
jgi:transposase